MADARQRWFDGGQLQRDQGAERRPTIDEKIQYSPNANSPRGIAKTHAIAGTVIIQNRTRRNLALRTGRNTIQSPNEVRPESRMDRAVSAIYERARHLN